MKIYCSTKKEDTFVRFGKRFKHGKSINYLAMNPRIKDIYSYRLAELQYGQIDEEEFNEWCEQALEEFVWEPNTSCFYYDKTSGLPIVNNVSQVKTLIGFIQRLEADLPCQAFLVKGTQVGTGTDQEPLVDVTQEEEIEYDIDELIDVAVEALADGFEIYDKSTDNYSEEFVHLKGPAYLYKDNLFIYPKAAFIKDWEYKGQVMDKLKFEEEVEVDYDNIACAYIPADRNGGKEEISDCISEWGDDIYTKPFYFENKYHIVVDIKPSGDIYVCGSEYDVDDFVGEYSIDYDYVDAPSKLAEKFRNSKFYE